MLRKHIRDELEHNKIKDLKELLDHPEVKSNCYGTKKVKGLKHFWHIKLDQEIPDNLKSLENLDISYCFALIENVFKKIRKNGTRILAYSDTKYTYVNNLRIIRNQKFAHMLLFETDDLIFSITVVKLEEIIRQLCNYDPSVSKEYLDRIEKVLDRNSFEDRDKVEMLTGLAKQKELFEEAIKKLENSNDKMMKNFSEKLVQFQESIINNSINIQEFEKLINDMKSNERSRNILLEKIDSKVSKIDVKTDKIGKITDKIGKKTDKIDEKTDKMVSLFEELPDKILTKIKEDNGM